MVGNNNNNTNGGIPEWGHQIVVLGIRGSPAHLNWVRSTIIVGFVTSESGTDRPGDTLVNNNVTTTNYYGLRLRLRREGKVKVTYKQGAGRGEEEEEQEEEGRKEGRKKKKKRLRRRLRLRLRLRKKESYMVKKVKRLLFGLG